jgi:16S rRNA (cytidine1402-2'-O)-methyltransferase
MADQGELAKTSQPARTGTLYLVPVPLDLGCAAPTALEQVLPAHTIEVAARLQHWVCENAKSLRHFLGRVGQHLPLACAVQSQHIVALPRSLHKHGDHDGQFDARPLLAAALDGHDMGLVSEAGLPAVADPGSSVVRAAHALGVSVVPLVGPSSLLLALCASGVNGQGFEFVGYLPQAEPARQQRLHALEQRLHRTGQTQIFIETPYRNAALWGALLTHLNAQTRLCVAAGLTLPDAVVVTRTVAQWREVSRACPANDQPAVFLIGR